MAIQVYENLLPGHPEIEFKFLNLKSRLIKFQRHLSAIYLGSVYDAEDISREIQEISQKAKIIQPDNHEFIVRLELLRANGQSVFGNPHGSLETYQQCLEEINEDEKLRADLDELCIVQTSYAISCLRLKCHDKAEELLHRSLGCCRKRGEAQSTRVRVLLLYLSHKKIRKRIILVHVVIIGKL